LLSFHQLFWTETKTEKIIAVFVKQDYEPIFGTDVIIDVQQKSLYIADGYMNPGKGEK